MRLNLFQGSLLLVYEGGVRGVRKRQAASDFFPNTETARTCRLLKLTSARLVIYSDNIVR